MNRQSVTVTTAAATDPVSTSDVKTHLRITGSDDDTYIGDLIDAAVPMVEEYLRRALVNRTLKLTLDYSPHRAKEDWWDGVREMPLSELRGERDYIVLPWPPVSSVTSVVTYDTDNSSSTFSSSNYSVDTASGRVYLNEGQVWPVSLRDRNAVEVTYVAGYGANASDVPAAIRRGIIMTVGALYESRDCGEIPDAASALLRPYRVLEERNNGL